PGVRRQRWNNDGVVGTNDTALFAELHPDSPFEHHDSLFHLVQMQRHRSARLGPVHEQADPACAEVLVREESAVDARPHQNFRDRASIDKRHENLYCVGSRSNGRRYSITSSAVESSVGGTSRPSALAVLRLITSSYLVGACTGRLAGFSPLRIRST